MITPRSLVFLIALLSLFPQSPGWAAADKKPPQFSGGSGWQLTADAGKTSELTFRIKDPDGGSVQVSMAQISPASPAVPASLAQSHGRGADRDYRFRWNVAPDFPGGLFRFRLTAADDENQTAQQTLTVYVRGRPTQPPQFSGGRGFQVTVDAGKTAETTFHIKDPDGGSVQAAMTQVSPASPAVPASLAQSHGSGADRDYRFSWNVDRNMPTGTFTFGLTAKDDENQTAQQSLTVYVRGRPTQTPQFSGGRGFQVTVDAGKTAETTFHIKDPDGGSVQAAMTQVSPATPAVPALLSQSHGSGADRDYRFSWNVDRNTPAGTFTFGLTAKDDENQTAQQSLTVNVRGLRPPRFDGLSDQTVSASKTLTFEVKAFDSGGAPVAVERSDAPGKEAPVPPAASFDGKTFSWATRAEDAGSYSITFKATDANGRQSTRAVTIKVTPLVHRVTPSAMPTPVLITPEPTPTPVSNVAVVTMASPTPTPTPEPEVPAGIYTVRARAAPVPPAPEPSPTPIPEPVPTASAPEVPAAPPAPEAPAPETPAPAEPPQEVKVEAPQPEPTPAEEVKVEAPQPEPTPAEEVKVEAPQPEPTPAEEVKIEAPQPEPTPAEEVKVEAPQPEPTPAEEVKVEEPQPEPSPEEAVEEPQQEEEVKAEETQAEEEKAEEEQVEAPQPEPSETEEEQVEEPQEPQEEVQEAAEEETQEEEAPEESESSEEEQAREPGHRRGVPHMPGIPDPTVEAGQRLTFRVEAKNDDGSEAETDIVPIMAGASFEDGVFDWTPDINDEGNYEIIVTAHNDNGIVQQKLTIHVRKARKNGKQDN